MTAPGCISISLAAAKKSAVPNGVISDWSMTILLRIACGLQKGIHTRVIRSMDMEMATGESGRGHESNILPFGRSRKNMRIQKAKPEVAKRTCYYCAVSGKSYSPVGVIPGQESKVC